MAEGLHIYFTSDDFLPAATGVGVHLGLIGPELVRRGYRVSVVTSRRPGQPELEQWQGVRVLRMPTLKAYGFYQAIPSPRAIRDLLAADRPDLVHHHYSSLMMRRFVGVAGAAGLRQVFTYHFGAEVLTHPWPLRPFRNWVQREIVRVSNACHLVISPSANLVQGLADMGVRVPIRHISNPVAFSAMTEVRPAPRPAGFVVLYAGRLGPEKNIGYLVRAFAQLRAVRADSALWIAGRGPEEPSLQRLCSELGLGGEVHFLGLLDHPSLARHYSACDTFVLPSLQEVQPLVAIEAMWFGRPVILTSALAAASELVAPGVNGYIVDPARVDDLSRRLIELSAQPALRETLGEASRARAEAFRPGTMVDALEQAYRDVLH